MSEQDPDIPDANAGEPVKVSIFNQTYTLRSASGGEHVLRVARLVDERMRFVASRLAVHDVAKVAVLVALNLADELESLKGARTDDAADAADEPERAQPDAPRTDDDEEEAPEAPAPRPRSWFDTIFDSEFSGQQGTDRLSEQVTSRLQRRRPPAQASPSEEGDEG